MDTAAWIALFNMIGIIAVAVFTYLGKRQGNRNEEKIEQVHKATNSMKDALVAATAKASFAEGAKSETDKLSKGA